MDYELVMRPEVQPMKWHAFCREAPSFSVAIDGYVIGGPRFDPRGPRANFNHHEGVDRLATRATCAQVLVAIRQGLFDYFRDTHGARIVVFANDCDQDVCTTSFLLRNSHLVVNTMNPVINRLVSMEDLMDTTAGAYPLPPDLPFLKELAWIYDPYTRFRVSGGLGRRSGGEYLQVVSDVEARIMQHVVGNGGRMELEFNYDRVGGGNGWVMVREIGAHARTKMFADGIRAYVSVRERPDGKSWTYTIGRMSQFVPFELSTLYDKLNLAEGIMSDARDRWGGAGTVGGSPRVAGSRLSPKEVEAIINDGR